jgi:hypothetical protein
MLKFLAQEILMCYIIKWCYHTRILMDKWCFYFEVAYARGEMRRKKNQNLGGKITCQSFQ